MAPPIVMAGAILILWLIFWLRLQNLMASEWAYDQGFYILFAYLMDRGLIPYQEIHMSEPPGMVWSLHLPFQLFGSIWGLRFAMLGYTLVGIAATIGLARLLAGPLAGLLAGAFLIFSYDFFGATVDPGVPAVSLALLALVLALRYRATRKVSWLGWSALALAGSFLLKLYMALAVPLVILIIYLAQQEAGLLPARRRSRFLRHALFWLGLVGLVMLAVYLLYGLPTLLDQTFFFHLNKSAVYPRQPSLNLFIIWGWFFSRPLFLLLSLCSLGLAWVERRRSGWIILAWLLLALIYLVILHPLRQKHLVMLVPLQVIVAGIVLSHWLTYKSGYKQGLTWTVRALGLGLTLLLFLQMLFTYTPPTTPMIRERDQPIVEALKRFTTPADCVVADNPYIALAANRLPPPWLANLSFARLDNGSLTSEDLIRITGEYGCQAVVPTFDRLKNSARTYYTWARDHYLRLWVINQQEFMVGQPLKEASPLYPVQADFGGQVVLLGLDWVLSPDGRPVYFSLYWRTLKPFSQNYKIFVQLRDAAGQTVASADHEPFEGLLPAQAWPAGQIVKDSQQFPLPDELPAGQYTLYVGLYDPATLERLPLIHDSSGENAVVFPALTLP